MLADEAGMRQAHEYLERDRDRWQSLAVRMLADLARSHGLTVEAERCRWGLCAPAGRPEGLSGGYVEGRADSEPAANAFYRQEA